MRACWRAGEPFVYAYYDGIDRVAHATGLGEHYEAELRRPTGWWPTCWSALPPGAVLVVTADHGQVEVGPSVEVLGAEVMDGVMLLSGEGRFRWLHTRPGAADDVAAAAAGRLRPRGLGPHPRGAGRRGVAGRGAGRRRWPSGWATWRWSRSPPTAFLDPADTGEQRLVGRHGSLTSAEMLVPLLAWRAAGGVSRSGHLASSGR